MTFSSFNTIITYPKEINHQPFAYYLFDKVLPTSKGFSMRIDTSQSLGGTEV